MRQRPWGGWPDNEEGPAGTLRFPTAASRRTTSRARLMPKRSEPTQLVFVAGCLQPMRLCRSGIRQWPTPEQLWALNGLVATGFILLVILVGLILAKK